MRLIDMDSHFAPIDEFAYVAEDLRHLTPAWLRHGQGRVAVVTPGSPEPSKRTGSHAPSRRTPGNFDPEARLKDMDAMGVERQLLNPEFGAYAFEVEPRLAAEMCRSANFAVGNALKAHPDRFIGSAVIPTQSIKASLEEADRALDAGFQTFFMKSAQGGKNFDDQYFWPLWDFANEHNVPFSVHANGRDWGTVTDPKRMGPSWGFFVATLADYCTLACSLIYSGVFDTFPNLKFCLGEAGVTWLPWLWDRLALTYEVDTNSRKSTQQHPTEYLLTNLYFTVDPTEESLSHLCQRFPPVNLMLGTDYPHGDITGRGHKPDKVAELRATHIDLLLERDDLTQEAKENIGYKNALAFLGGRVS
jgi:predicted TIM-barrel fold metal-dependent hydrolase